MERQTKTSTPLVGIAKRGTVMSTYDDKNTDRINMFWNALESAAINFPDDRTAENKPVIEISSIAISLKRIADALERG